MIADFVLWCVQLLCEARAVWMMRVFFVATMHLTSAYHSQSFNKITSLDGVKFPAGLTDLYLVSFHDCRLCVVVCAGDV